MMPSYYSLILSPRAGSRMTEPKPGELPTATFTHAVHTTNRHRQHSATILTYHQQTIWPDKIQTLHSEHRQDNPPADTTLPPHPCLNSVPEQITGHDTGRGQSITRQSLASSTQYSRLPSHRASLHTLQKCAQCHSSPEPANDAATEGRYNAWEVGTSKQRN